MTGIVCCLFYHIVWFVLTWNNDDPQRRNTLIKTSQISVLTFFRSLCDMCSPSTPWICWHSISLPFPDFLFLTSRNCHQLTFYCGILCGILFGINSGKYSLCLIFCPALFLAFYLGFCFILSGIYFGIPYGYGNLWRSFKGFYVVFYVVITLFGTLSGSRSGMLCYVYLPYSVVVWHSSLFLSVVYQLALYDSLFAMFFLFRASYLAFDVAFLVTFNLA